MDTLAGQTIGDYTLTAYITETYLSVIYESIDTKSVNCTKLAIKLLKHTNSREQVTEEININLNCKCFYTMPVMGIVENVPSDFLIAIVMPNAIGRDLFQMVLDYGQLSEDIVSQIAYAGLKALQYLHNNFIIHRDIKPDNFFLMDDSITKLDIVLGDFGHATHFNPGQKLTDFKIGTLIYNAPEIINNNPYDERVDIWSLGATLYFTLSGCYAFPDPREDNNPLSEQYTKRLITKGQYEMEFGLWEEISPEAKDFVSSMLQVDPDNRPTIADLLNHPFIRNHYVEYNKQRNRTEGKTLIIDESFRQADEFLDEND